MDELVELHGKPFPWHWSNAIYLEWNSESNGRVVIETSEFHVSVTGVPSFQLSEVEFAADAKDKSGEFCRYVENLSVGFEHSDEVAAWKPLTEEEADAMQAQSDRLVDRVHARMERQGDEADLDEIISQEVERARRERGEPDFTPEQEAERSRWIDEANRAAEEALANPDPELLKELAIRHPLAERAFALALELSRMSSERGWITDAMQREHPLVELVAAVMTASAKLAGALNGTYWPPRIESTAAKLVRLKRARNHLDDAARAAECLKEIAFADLALLQCGMLQVQEIARQLDGLIAECRARLETYQ